jgi:S-phase kinase-associated protein 1
MSLQHSGDGAVTLVSGDGHAFTVAPQVAASMGTVTNMLEDVGLDAPLPLPNVDARTLALVLEFAAAGDLTRMQATMSQRDLLNVLAAASYLNYARLESQALEALADQMVGKSPEEVRALFNMRDSMTSEQKAEVKRRRETWAFE